jgi:PadR family transcriptional regulator, regulatory protein PadR
MTTATKAVLRAFLADPIAELYGLEVGAETSLAPGTVQPILFRFEGLGWLESRWENVDPSEAGRPRRRYYRLTGHGAELARNAIVRAEQRSAKSRKASGAVQPGLADGAL